MKRTSRNKIITVVSILVIIFLIVVFTGPKLFDLNRYNSKIVSAIEKATGGDAELGQITWGFHTGLWLESDNFSLSGARGVFGDITI